MKSKIKEIIPLACALINRAHIYDSKSESFAKASIFTISWILGVHVAHASQELNSSVGLSYFLFAISLIIEYIFRLLSVKKFSAKILPAAINILSILTAAPALALSYNRSFNAVSFQHLWLGAFIPIVIIWLDTIAHIFIEPPQNEGSNENRREARVEDDLKNVRVENVKWMLL